MAILAMHPSQLWYSVSKMEPFIVKIINLYSRLAMSVIVWSFCVSRPINYLWLQSPLLYIFKSKVKDDSIHKQVNLTKSNK